MDKIKQSTVLEQKKAQVQAGEEEIDLLDLAGYLLQHIKMLLLCLVMGAVLAFAVTKLFITPIYTAESMVYIFTKTTSITSLADLQMGSQLTVDFQTLATSRPVVEKVIETLGLDTTYEELVETITIENPSNSRILELYVENPDPQQAADISNALADALCDRVAEVMSTDRPTIAASAVVPQKASSPSVMKNTAVGGLLGLVLICGVFTVIYLMDDTIKDPSDVEKYLGLNVLASIPDDGTKKEKKKKGSAKKGSDGKKSSKGSKTAHNAA